MANKMPTVVVWSRFVYLPILMVICGTRKYHRVRSAYAVAERGRR
ncbi:hypothetical protein [Actinopolyspora mzabensis]|nr:hypothetical protein [Actinopolyspora mzabensis]